MSDANHIINKKGKCIYCHNCEDDIDLCETRLRLRWKIECDKIVQDVRDSTSNAWRNAFFYVFGFLPKTPGEAAIQGKKVILKKEKVYE